MNLDGKRNHRKSGNKRESAITPTNIVIMVLTVILVIAIGIYFGDKWTQMLVQREEARMAARNNASTFSNFIGAFVQIIVACIIIYVFLRGLKYKKAKEEEYDEKVLKKAIAEVLPNAEFIRNGCIEPRILYEYGIIPVYDNYKKRGMIHYQIDKKDYYFSNIHLLSRKEDKDEHVYYDTIYKGQIYMADYKTGVSGIVRIFATKKMAVIKKKTNAGYASKRSGETKIETENIQFNDNFDVYATSDQAAFCVLSPYVMEQLLELKSNYEQVGVYINENHVVIALKTDRILFPERIYIDQREAESLEASKAEVRKMLKMAEFLEDSINGSIKNNLIRLRER